MQIECVFIYNSAINSERITLIFCSEFGLFLTSLTGVQLRCVFILLFNNKHGYIIFSTDSDESPVFNPKSIRIIWSKILFLPKCFLIG